MLATEGVVYICTLVAVEYKCTTLSCQYEPSGACVHRVSNAVLPLYARWLCGPLPGDGDRPAVDEGRLSNRLVRVR